MFRVFKPKNVVRVNAVQVTTENVQKLAVLLMGRVNLSEVNAESNMPTLIGLIVPTFDGVKAFSLGTWILRDENNNLSSMKDDEFQKQYEVARNTEKS